MTSERPEAKASRPLNERRRSLWMRLERQSLWIAMGLMGGTAAGAFSLEPSALQRLASALPGWSQNAPTAGAPLAAADAPAPAVAAPALAPAPLAPAPAGAAKPASVAPPAKAQEERALDANSADLLEEDGPLWDSSQSE